MALKGQNFNSYTLDFKQEVINSYKFGTYGGRNQVAKHYNISFATIWNWIYKDRKQGSQINDIYKKRGHHKKPITLEDYKERYEILKKYQAFLKAQRERK